MPAGAPLAAQPADARPGSVTIAVKAEAKRGTTPGQGAPKGVDPYGADDGSGAGSVYAGVNYRRLDDIVVWLEPAGAIDAPREAWGAEAAEPVVIDIRPAPGGGKAPAVPVFGAGVGQTVRFRNDSGASLRVFSFAEGNEFRVGPLAPGAKADWPAAKPGVFEVLTSAHDEPVAEVVVAPTRFVQRARAGDEVKFARVPAGSWTARAWHRRIPAAPAPVEVKPGGRAAATLTLTVESLPDAP